MVAKHGLSLNKPGTKSIPLGKEKKKRKGKILLKILGSTYLHGCG
jgi:hypothetical protein